MAESKKIHLELDFPATQAELFRIFVESLNFDEEGNPNQEASGAEIIYEEDYEWQAEKRVSFSLWFDKPRTAYYFALGLEEARRAWASFAPTSAEQRELDEVLRDIQGFGWSLALLTVMGQTWQGKEAEADEAWETLVHLQQQIRRLEARRVALVQQLVAQEGGPDGTLGRREVPNA